MRKTALLLIALIALPAGLWAAEQPVRVPCPEMTMAGGGPAPDPCPLRDCCRITPPEAPPSAVVAAPAQVRIAGIFLLPILLQTRFAPAPAACDQAAAPATASLHSQKPPPSALLIPLRV